MEERVVVESEEGSGVFITKGRPGFPVTRNATTTAPWSRLRQYFGAIQEYLSVLRSRGLL